MTLKSATIKTAPWVKCCSLTIFCDGGTAMFADIVVVILVMSPVELPAPATVPEPLWRGLEKVALIIEIVGPHERWRSDFNAELRYVRYHWRELADAPPGPTA